MATATVSIRKTTGPRTDSTTRAAVLSVLGSVLAIGVAAVGLLVVPAAVIVVFGPALLAAF